MKKGLIAAAFVGALLSSVAYAQELPKTHVSVVGNLSFDPSTVDFEKPFWTSVVPKLSNGQVTADFKSFDEMGLKGPEILRLMSQGVIQFGTATLSYFASEDPINDAMNLVGMAPDVKTQRMINDTFEPVYEERLKKRGIKVLGTAINAGQVLYCNAKIKGLADIAGKKVRITSRTQADFIEALGGSGVNMAFAEVVPALQTKVIDCAITGSLPGYNAKWYEVSTHLLELPLNWNPLIYAVNLKTWEKLDPKVQSFLETNFNKMLNEIWVSVAKQTQEGYDCSTGAAECKRDVKGKMTLVKPSAADFELLKKVAYESVVPKWAERCSAECVQSFNGTIGEKLGIKAEK